MGKNNPQRIEKPLWGWEMIHENNLEGNRCVKDLHLLEGRWCSLQYHREKSETHYVTEGAILMLKGPDGGIIEDEEGNILEVLGENKLKLLMPGKSAYIPPYTAHRCGSLTGTSVIREESTYHKDSDTYRLEETVKGSTNVIPEEIMEEYVRRLERTKEEFMSIK